MKNLSIIILATMFAVSLMLTSCGNKKEEVKEEVKKEITKPAPVKKEVVIPDSEIVDKEYVTPCYLTIREGHKFVVQSEQTIDIIAEDGTREHCDNFEHYVFNIMYKDYDKAQTFFPEAGKLQVMKDKSVRIFTEEKGLLPSRPEAQLKRNEEFCEKCLEVAGL